MPSMSGSTPHRSSATAGVLVSRECSPDPLIDTCAVDTFRATFVRRRPSTGPSMSVRSTCDAPSRAHAMPGRPEMPLPSSTTHLPTRDDDRFRSMYFARTREASQQVVPPGARACVRGERGAGAGSFRSTYSFASGRPGLCGCACRRAPVRRGWSRSRCRTRTPCRSIGPSPSSSRV